MNRVKSVAEFPMSADTRRLNPTLAGGVGLRVPAMPAQTVPKPLLKQSSKPLMNCNELAFLQFLKDTRPGAFIHAQEVHLGLANGVRYTPDFMTYEPMGTGLLCFWEVKGKRKIFDGAGEKLKFAAAKYPEFVFTLVWRDGDEIWQQQRIIP